MMRAKNQLRNKNDRDDAKKKYEKAGSFVSS